MPDRVPGGLLGDPVDVRRGPALAEPDHSLAQELAVDPVLGPNRRREVLQRRDQPVPLDFREQEALGEAPGLLDALLDQGHDLVDLGRLRGGAGRELRAKRLGDECGAGQVLAQPVMEVVADRAALSLGDLQDDLLQAHALGDLLGQCRRALAHALLHLAVEGDHAGEEPDHDQVGAEGDQRVPAGHEGVREARPRKDVPDQPGGHAEHGRDRPESPAHGGDREAHRQEIEHQERELEAGEVVGDADDRHEAERGGHVAALAGGFRRGQDAPPEALAPALERAGGGGRRLRRAHGDAPAVA